MKHVLILIALLLVGCVEGQPKTAAEAAAKWAPNYVDCVIRWDKFENLRIHCPAIPGTSTGESAALYSFDGGDEPCDRPIEQDTWVCNPYAHGDKQFPYGQTVGNYAAL
jgi:hypothetical protein